MAAVAVAAALGMRLVGRWVGGLDVWLGGGEFGTTYHSMCGSSFVRRRDERLRYASHRSFK